MSQYTYDAKTLFALLQKEEAKKDSNKRESIYIPTDEQIAIIEADPFSPAVVIAGAGSGKTETMGARVLW